MAAEKYLALLVFGDSLFSKEILTPITLKSCKTLGRLGEGRKEREKR